MKKLVTSAVLAAATIASVPAMAELSANAAVTTNYVWRGATGSTDKLAVQGGADWANESGLYAGTWASTLGDNTGNEVDFYAGKVLGDMGPVAGLDAGIIMYTNTDDLLGAGDVIEGKVAGSFGMVNAELYLSLKTPSVLGTSPSYTYISANTEIDVSGINVSPYVGSYGGDFAGTHFGVTASKEVSGFDISAMIDISDADLSDDTLFSITASKGFEL